jgi:hypothetical protein
MEEEEEERNIAAKCMSWMQLAKNTAWWQNFMNTAMDRRV